MRTSDELLNILSGILLACSLFATIRYTIGDRSRGRRRCPKCWYDMSATEGMGCPECGRVQKREGRFFRARRRKVLFALAMVLVLGAYAAHMTRKVRRHGVYRYLPTWTLVCLTPARVPESLYDEIVITDFDVINAGGPDVSFPYRDVMKRKLSAIERRALGEIRNRRTLDGLHRWIWLTRDRFSEPRAGEFRIVVDIQSIWEPHSYDLVAERVVMKRPFLDGGSIFFEQSPPPASLSVRLWRDRAGDVSADDFIERYIEVLRWGMSGLDYSAMSEHAEGMKTQGVRELLEPRAGFLDIAWYRFGSHVVLTGPAADEETVRLRMRMLADVIPMADASGAGMTAAERAWFGREITIDDVRALLGPIEDWRIYSDEVVLLPYVIRAYHMPDGMRIDWNNGDIHAADRGDGEPDSIGGLSWALSRIRFADRMKFGSRIEKGMGVERIGSSFLVFAPVEFQPVIVRAVELFLAGEFEERGPTVIYREGEFVPYIPNK